jgi:hypothetical protein
MNVHLQKVIGSMFFSIMAFFTCGILLTFFRSLDIIYPVVSALGVSGCIASMYTIYICRLDGGK